MNFLRSEKHEIDGVTVSKTTLSLIDTKRWIADDGVNTRTYGYNPLSATSATAGGEGNFSLTLMDEDLEKILELF